jgi:acyl-CoA synthetase (AMP-forming)/AMP-acid ligase II
VTVTVGPLALGADLPWVARLAEHGTRPALVTAERTVTYAALRRRVDELAAQLAGPRRLVLAEGRRTPESVVAYLAALAAGHAVLLTAGGAGGPAQRLRAAYDPDVVLGPDGSVDIVRAAPAHPLHPDLGVLLSTSGSTGSAKLVRLSAENLAVNAEQIAGYLDIRDDDCAAMTVPLTYCYGLSVLHTHLARGASVLLTDLSVADERFWRLFDAAGASTFPGVPHTFDLLERSGFAERDLPRLRYVTQAGGRMDPDHVRRWTTLGRERGWDLFVMYGQAEATARMAYLPPHLALEHPGTVGVPVPGGTIEIEDGEIVFRGPNVMLGYAHGPADLALGRTTHALRTGDLGRITPEGLVQVVGRRARFVKVLGHRVDLDSLEQRLRGEGHDVRCAGRDDRVVVAGRGSAAAPAREALRRAVVRACGAPPGVVRVVPVEDHPTLDSGKPDYPAILRLDHVDADLEHDTSVGRLYATLLDRRDIPGDATFVGLGGDSLSYVEVSVRLEELLGHLPDQWHVMPVQELERLRRRRDLPTLQEPAEGPTVTPPVAGKGVSGRAWRTLETSVWLRALAIVLIVGTHADLFSLQGTANALLVLAGHQFARFQLAEPERRARVARIGRATLRVVAPSVVVIAGAHVLLGAYEPHNLVLANWIFGEARLGPAWRFWFLEALVLALAVSAALNAVPAVHRLERRFPFALPVGADRRRVRPLPPAAPAPARPADARLRPRRAPPLPARVDPWPGRDRAPAMAPDVARRRDGRDLLVQPGPRRPHHRRHPPRAVAPGDARARVPRAPDPGARRGVPVHLRPALAGAGRAPGATGHRLPGIARRGCRLLVVLEPPPLPAVAGGGAPGHWQAGSRSDRPRGGPSPRPAVRRPVVTTAAAPGLDSVRVLLGFEALLISRTEQNAHQVPPHLRLRTVHPPRNVMVTDYRIGSRITPNAHSTKKASSRTMTTAATTAAVRPALSPRDAATKPRATPAPARTTGAANENTVQMYEATVNGRPGRVDALDDGLIWDMDMKPPHEGT